MAGAVRAMNTTMTIDLGGRSFTLDERAYAALRSYLDRAAARLGNHPDRTEVLAGLERSIAAKLGRRAPSGGVCDEATVAAALQDVGPVEGPNLGEPDRGPEPGATGGGTPWGSRRLYRLREGQMIAGVCAGLAAFLEIDANIMRLLFIVAGLFTGGVLVLAYVVLMFVMPPAQTEEEIAAAHGGGRRGRNRAES
jgi:phage shock protein PspC (stress-responsive transcriptional regulator)